MFEQFKPSVTLNFCYNNFPHFFIKNNFMMTAHLHLDVFRSHYAAWTMSLLFYVTA